MASGDGAEDTGQDKDTTGQLEPQKVLQDTILQFFAAQDPQRTGSVPNEAFWTGLTTADVGLYLSQEELEALAEVHQTSEAGEVSYATFAQYAHEHVVHLHSQRPEHSSEWAYIMAPPHGPVWFNKRTSELAGRTPDTVIRCLYHPELYAAAAPEAGQGVGQGVISKYEEELDQAHEDLMEAQAKLEHLTKTSVGGPQATALEAEVAALKAEREQLLRDLQAATSKLESATVSASADQDQVSGIIRERDECRLKLRAAEETTVRLTKEAEAAKAEAAGLQAAAGEAKAMQQQVATLKGKLAAQRKAEQAASTAGELQGRVASLEAEVQTLRAANDEKAKSLSAVRVQLREAGGKRQARGELEERVDALQKQLEEQKEIQRTSKAFLASKSKLLAEKSSEVTRLQQRLGVLEVKDTQRGKVVQDMLQRTSQLGQGGSGGGSGGGGIDRPFSASATPVPVPRHVRRSPGRGVAAGAPKRSTAVAQNNSTGPARRRTSEQQSPSRTTKFPPLVARNTMKVPLPSAPKGPSEADDLAACHVRVGDRVLIRGGRVAGLTKQYGGMVKFVGRVDSQYDRDLYVGLKMDEPVGDHDGVFNGKRYFKCSEKHGRLVPLSDVLSVLTTKVGGSARKKMTAEV